MVLIESGFITHIDTTGAEPPAGVPLEDLGDVTVLPGLIDTHTHLAFDASDEVVAHVQQATPEELSAQMRRAAASMLRCGITTIRDLGDRDYLSFTIREETAVRSETGPTILAAGPPLTPTGGHCWFLGGQADGLDGIRPDQQIFAGFNDQLRRDLVTEAETFIHSVLLENRPNTG